MSVEDYMLGGQRSAVGKGMQVKKKIKKPLKLRLITNKGDTLGGLGKGPW